MQNNGLPLSDVSRALPVCIPAWTETAHTHYPARLSQDAALRTFPADSDLPRILHHIFQQAPCLTYAGNLFSGSLSIHDIKQPFSSVSDSSGFLFHSGKDFSAPLQVFSLLFCKT